MPIALSFDSENFQEELNKFVNYHIVRIAKNHLAKYEYAVSEGISTRKRDSETIKIFELIEECSRSVKADNNKKNTLSELIKIRNRIEDIYSDLCVIAKT